MDVPTEDLVRAVMPGAELRADGDAPRVLFGHFARFGEWTEIHSWWEGDFMERIKKGAFRKTMKDNRSGIKVLYDHGHDFQVGNKVLGAIDDLREDDEGAYYEVPLFDTSYNRDLLPGLEAGVYGASFRFTVVKERWDQEPAAADHNPAGLPERTIEEVRLFEFGPVTFPAYEGASAGVRSLTDYFRERSGISRDSRDRTRPGRAADSAEGAGATGHHSQAAREKLLRRSALDIRGVA